jgi:hypothetical protein
MNPLGMIHIFYITSYAIVSHVVALSAEAKLIKNLADAFKLTMDNELAGR